MNNSIGLGILLCGTVVSIALTALCLGAFAESCSPTKARLIASINYLIRSIESRNQLHPEEMKSAREIDQSLLEPSNEEPVFETRSRGELVENRLSAKLHI